MKLSPYFIPYMKINLKWTKDLNVISETITSLEENIGESLLDIGLGNDFLDMTIKAQAALTVVAQCVGCHPANQNFAGLIPGQDTCLGCGPGPRLDRGNPIDVSLAHRCFSPCLFPFPSL